MIYKGNAIEVSQIEDDIANLCFDLTGSSVNKLNKTTLLELEQAVKSIESEKTIKGLLLSSKKDSFIVGADITEFTQAFSGDEADLYQWLDSTNQIFNKLEDLPIPTVALINGLALGGGFELCLACDFRLASHKSQIGLPEVKLGIVPGFGGTVRLSRLIGADNAIEWICTGQPQNTDSALKTGAIDSAINQELLTKAGISIIRQCQAGLLDNQSRKKLKTSPLKLNAIESVMAFESAQSYIQSKAGSHYPAPILAVKIIEQHAKKCRNDALTIESKYFVKIAKTEVADNLIHLFLQDQALKKQVKTLSQDALEVNKAAILGAGIMGGGIAYQSAYKKVPVIMKDISQKGLDLGLRESALLLQKQVQRKHLKPERLGQVLNSIQPSLSYSDFGEVDIAIEAVVENKEIKSQVLSEAESNLSKNAILASNTSTISINELAKNLRRPEQFCGMHFFNPVHRMPLVEVIKGAKTNQKTLSSIVQYAIKLGKKPIIVEDCPGFFINRVLFPYLGAALLLIKEGIDFVQVDSVMEKFGWPMGPAYLLDTIGIDTSVHAQSVLAQGYPDRMSYSYQTALDILYAEKRLGKKTNCGFYLYEKDKKGQVKKTVDDKIYPLLSPHCEKPKEINSEQIIHRLMTPLCLETLRCLEEKIVQSAAEADLGLIYGIGFPPFIGGALRYIEQMGLAEFINLADSYKDLSPAYAVTQNLRDMAKKKQSFFN